MKRALQVALVVLAFALILIPQTTPNLGLVNPAFGTQNWNVSLYNGLFAPLDSYLSGGSTLPAFKAHGLTLDTAGLSTNTAAVSGNATVGGTLGVTGALSGSSGIFGGALQAASANLSNGALSNATATGVASGNNLTLLNYQKSLSPMTGTGSSVVVYTYTLPGNTLQNGKGIRISTSFTHTGVNSCTVSINIGAASVPMFTSSVTVTQSATVIFQNDPGSQTSNAIETADNSFSYNNANFGTSTVNTAANVTISLSFNVASPDTLTPQMFLVELIQ